MKSNVRKEFKTQWIVAIANVIRVILAVAAIAYAPTMALVFQMVPVYVTSWVDGAVSYARYRAALVLIVIVVETESAIVKQQHVSATRAGPELVVTFRTALEIRTVLEEAIAMRLAV